MAQAKVLESESCLPIKQPWRAIEVDKTGCSIEERITINDEIGLVADNKCDANERPGDVKRMLAIHTPLRLEFYVRSARSGLRVDWKAPYNMASDTFSNIVQLARKNETSRSDIVRYGLASKPILELSQDAACKTMPFHYAYSSRVQIESGSSERV